MLTEQQWKLMLGMYKSGMIEFEDIYGTIVEQCTAASNGAKPIVSGAVCESNHHNLDIKHIGCCLDCGNDKLLQTDR